MTVHVHENGDEQQTVKEPFAAKVTYEGLMSSMAALYAQDAARMMKELAFKEEVEKDIRAELEKRDATIAVLTAENERLRDEARESV